jgi:hypothetical protein
MKIMRHRYVILFAALVMGSSLGMLKNLSAVDCPYVSSDCTVACYQDPYEDDTYNALNPDGEDAGTETVGTTGGTHIGGGVCGHWYTGHDYDCPDATNDYTPGLGDVCPDDPQ